MDTLLKWQKNFPKWLEEDEKFKKWVLFLRAEEIEKARARRYHSENMSNEKKLWKHAKTNTMKLFFYDRDDRVRFRVLSDNAKKLDKFMNFIKQMSKEKQKRKCDKLIKVRV